MGCITYPCPRYPLLAPRSSNMIVLVVGLAGWKWQADEILIIAITHFCSWRHSYDENLIVSHNVFATYIHKRNGPLSRNEKIRVARFSRHRLQRKPLASDPGMHHGTSVTHVPWCMSGSLTRGGATLKFTYLVSGQWYPYFNNVYFNIFKIFKALGFTLYIWYAWIKSYDISVIHKITIHSFQWRT